MIRLTPLKTTLEQLLISTALGAARVCGRVLLGVQAGLAWLDSPHPVAAQLRPGVAFVGRHGNSLMLAFGAGLLAMGGGAFAIVTLGPDASRLPVRQHMESVSVPSMPQQLAALDLHELKLQRNDSTRQADTPEALLRRLGIMDARAARFMRNHPQLREAIAQPGRSVSAEVTGDQALTSLSVRWLHNENDSHFRLLTLARVGSGFDVRLEALPMTVSLRMSGGTVSSSLYAASDEARLPDSIVEQLTDIFSSQIDFHRKLSKGARFAVVYEVLEAEGEPLRTGKVLSAEFVNDGKTYQAVWFQEPGEKGGYYSLDGHSLRRTYLAAPVAYSRKTSGVGLRVHPVYNTLRVHEGVDYAAPTGTPTYTVGDGVVESADWQNGYGNTVVVRHSNTHTTVYAHLSRIQVRKGQNVAQGQVIGAVGSTGVSTGAHLHFEFRINGVYADPDRVLAQAQNAPISSTTRAAFMRQAHTSRMQLAAATQMRDGNDL